MPIDFDRNFLFLHIPKTGGSSILKYLEVPYGPEHMYSSTMGCDETTGEPLREFWLQHFTLEEVVWGSQFHIRINSPDGGCYSLEEQGNIIRNMFKFCFVRNPWDRAVSDYLWHKYNPGRYLDEKVASNMDLEMFLNPEHVQIPHCHRRQQIDFAKDANFVGRYETLKYDFSTLCNIIEVPFVSENFPHEKKSVGRKHYSHYYDDKTKKMIEDIYHDDISHFGYKFEDHR